MLGALFELFPLFLVRWLARRHCMRLHDGHGRIFIQARPDVYFLPRRKRNTR